MTLDYETKLEIAKFAYKEMMKAMKLIKSGSQYDIKYNWCGSLWVDEEFFHEDELKD